MSQAINFYEKLGPESRMPSALVYIWSAWILVVAVYLIWASTLFFQQWSTQNEITSLGVDNARMAEQLRLEDEMGDASSIVNLESKIADLIQQRKLQGLLIGQLKASEQNGSYGFSELMLGLARQHDGSVSLDMIEALESGEITLSGVLASAEDLPKFVLNIGSEPAFAGRAFETVEISEVDSGLAFKLLSSGAAYSGAAYSGAAYSGAAVSGVAN